MKKLNLKQGKSLTTILYLTSIILLSISAPYSRAESAELSSYPGHTFQEETETVEWKGPDENVLPFKSYEEIEEFLQTAEVVEMEEIPSGITLPKKITLEKDGIKMHAVFRYKDFSKRRWESGQGLRMNFRDSYLFECAAYELGKILGINNIPPVVLREIDGEEGTVQAWVENAMTEEKRLKEKIDPPNRIRWLYQTQVMRVFDSLIYNDDRNLGNYLWDQDWRLWIIDFTRAFQSVPELKDPEKVLYCERALWEKIQNLKEEEVREKVETPGYLTEAQVRTLMKRKEKLIEYIEELIEEKGQGAVLYSFF
jgi:hypothetical protein